MPTSFKEFSGIREGRDVTRSFVEFLGNYIPTQDSLLLDKSGGLLDLYEKVLQDDRVKSCYQQRFSGLTSKEIEVVPGGDKRIDKQAAEHIQKQLERINWDNITEKMSYGVHYGYSIAECLYGREDGKVILTDIKVRNRRRFHFGYDQLPKLKTFTNPLGEELPAQKFWHFCTGADNDDEPYGLGLGHWLYWLTWFKRNDVKWWVTFLENFADPSTIGHYPIGATDAQKKTLQGAVQNIGKTKWATLPEGMLVELLEASRSGTADYQGMHDALNTAISTLILSQSMTSESGSSEAQATVHKDVGDTVIESDDALISSSFNASVVTWLTDWNFPGAAIPRVRRKLEPPEDLKATADRDAVIVNMGFPLDPEYVVKTYGEGFKAVETDTAQTSLNGAQLQAFVSLVTSAQMGGWSPEMVKTALLISFPHVPEKLIEQMAKTMGGMPPVDPNADPNNPQPVDPNAPTQPQQQPSLDDVAAQFAEALDEVALQFEVEFKLKEGTTKEVNGKQYILTNSRWRRADVAPKAEKKPKAATSKPLTETQKTKKEKILKNAAVEVKPAKDKGKSKIKPNLPTEDVSTKTGSTESKFISMADGLNPAKIIVSPEDIKLSQKFVDDAGKGYVSAKISKMQKDAKLSKEEANAMATWIGRKYASMNAILYGGQPNAEFDRDAIEVTNILAAKAMHKLPAVTRKQIVDEAKKKNEPYDSAKPLGRYMTVPDPEAFVARYREAAKGDGIVRESTFFATSHIDRSKFMFCNDTTNITYEVTPKLDGSGNGRYIDHYKNVASEGEILYPPQTKFKVIGVDSPKPPKAGKELSAEDKKDLANYYILMQVKYGFGNLKGDEKQAAIAKQYAQRSGLKGATLTEADLNALEKKGKLIMKKQSKIEDFNKSNTGKSRDTNYVIRLQEI